MEIHYKGIAHERTEDAPFIGALVCAMDCEFNCYDCFNQHLRDVETPFYVNTAEEIVAKIKENPFNEGILLAGLEWSLQPLELVELASVASKAGLQVMIYTGNSLLDFQRIIGQSCAKKYGMSDEIEKNIVSENDSGIYAFMGGMILDTLINAPYYIKCGRYDETKRVYDRVQFGVQLASENQTIYKFMTDVEDKDYGKNKESGNLNGVRYNGKPAGGNRAKRRKHRGK